MEAFIGTIVLFAGNYVPRGWVACDGHSLAINQNQALFSILGTTYGGDGVVHFAVPKMDAPSGMQYMLCVDGIYPPRD